MDDQLNAAKQFWQAGKPADAEAAARATLARGGEHPDALLIVGMAMLKRDDAAGAIEYLTRAAALNSTGALPQQVLAEACTRADRPSDAIAAYRMALAIEPNSPGALNNLAILLDKQKRFDEAIELYQRAVAIRPDYANAWTNLASALLLIDRFADALSAAQRAAALLPDHPLPLGLVGAALNKLRRYHEALPPLRRSVALDPNNPKTQYHLGLALLVAAKEFDDAARHLSIARRLQPGFVDVYYALGAALSELGLIDEATEIFRAGTRIAPNAPDMGSNLLFTMNFKVQQNAAEMLYEARAWAERVEAPLRGTLQPHGNDRDPNRKLRIGYVSPDFRDHCQRLFTIPLLSNHDRSQFEIVCYNISPASDPVTARIRSLADEWRECAEKPFAQFAEQIREDKIDILVDLTMHMWRNLLPAFAHKPAPVQVTWLAYPGTTGLTTMDYRLSDPVLDPPDTEAGKYSEQTVLLPDTFWCYDAQSDEPVSPLPADANGFITFGCLNGFHKVNERGIALWSAVMNVIPDSRFVLLAPSGSPRQRIIDQFERAGVPRDRIEFVSFEPRDKYLKTYRRIDIALDTIPYNGHTTSLDAFWCGVPVVTMVAETVVGRAGLSQLTNLKLTELAAQQDDEFVRIASALARDRDRLRELRKTLRERMQTSPLMDAKRFARNIEAAYRTMWVTWCEKEKARG